MVDWNAERAIFTELLATAWERGRNAGLGREDADQNPYLDSNEGNQK